MPYLHSVDCLKCGHESYVCTSDADGIAHGTQYEYECPTCKRRIVFSSLVAEIIEGNEEGGEAACPEGSVPGKLFLSRSVQRR